MCFAIAFYDKLILGKITVIFSKYTFEEKDMLRKRLLFFCVIIMISGSAYCVGPNKDGIDNSRSGLTDVMISQSVTGSLADTSQLFEFKVYFKNSGGSVITDTVINYTGGVLGDINVAPPANASVRLAPPNGIGLFSLKHGQTVTFIDIPSDWMMCVTMVRDALYLPKFIDSDGAPGQLGVNSTDERPLSPGKRAIAFTNDRLEIILTGIADIERSDMAFVVMAGAIVFMCLTSALIKYFANRPHN